jgi:hypothetical protein
MVINAILKNHKNSFPNINYFFGVDTTIIFQNLKNQIIGHKPISSWLDALCMVVETKFGFYFVFITIKNNNCYDLWFRLMLEQNLHEIEIKNELSFVIINIK